MEIPVDNHTLNNIYTGITYQSIHNYIKEGGRYVGI